MQRGRSSDANSREEQLRRADGLTSVVGIVVAFGRGVDASLVDGVQLLGPLVLARSPREVSRERVHQVEEGDGHQAAVVGGDADRPHHLSVPHA
jgi:hypothetical protein